MMLHGTCQAHSWLGFLTLAFLHLVLQNLLSALDSDKPVIFVAGMGLALDGTDNAWCVFF